MKPRPLIITGMPRSGTTLVQELCDNHPQMRVTKEFGNYLFVGESLIGYMRGTARRARRINGKWRPYGFRHEVPTTRLQTLRIRGANQIANGFAVMAHVLRIARSGTGPVTLSALVAAESGDGEMRVVGDKYPQYIFRMHQFVELPELLRLVIYRDCRDVTSSFLKKLRADWKNQSWIRSFDTVEKIARKWVEGIEIMERHAGSLFVVRYEALVSDTEAELRHIAEWLDVDPSGFDSERVFGSSVGSYRRGLTAKELDEVLAVAGPTLERLGYPLD
jgi:hypothetical protein